MTKLGCSVCGYAVDVLRSCYASEWRFPGVEGTVAGYFYFNDDAECYDGLTYFGSRNWHAGDGTPWPEYGEIEGAKQRWRNGSFVGRRPAAVRVGTADQVEGLAPMPGPTDAGTWGLPMACWPEGPPYILCGEGGDADDGTAAQVVAEQLASGGDADDGTADQFPPEQLGWGGDADDGTAAQQLAEQLGEGGDADDGEAMQDVGPGGITFGPCSGLPATLTVTIGDPLGGPLNGVNWPITWDGSQYEGTTTACGGSTVYFRMYESGGVVYFELLVDTVGPTNGGPSIMCGPPFNAYHTLSGGLGGCGGFIMGDATVSG